MTVEEAVNDFNISENAYVVIRDDLENFMEYSEPMFMVRVKHLHKYCFKLLDTKVCRVVGEQRDIHLLI